MQQLVPEALRRWIRSIQEVGQEKYVAIYLNSGAGFPQTPCSECTSCTVEQRNLMTHLGCSPSTESLASYVMGRCFTLRLHNVKRSSLFSTTSDGSLAHWSARTEQASVTLARHRGTLKDSVVKKNLSVIFWNLKV